MKNFKIHRSKVKNSKNQDFKIQDMKIPNFATSKRVRYLKTSRLFGFRWKPKVLGSSAMPGSLENFEDFQISIANDDHLRASTECLFPPKYRGKWREKKKKKNKSIASRGNPTDAYWITGCSVDPWRDGE